MQTKIIEKDSVHVDSTAQIIIKKKKGDSTGLKFNIADAAIGKILYPETSNVKSLDNTFDPIVFTKKTKTGNITAEVDVTKKGNVTVSCKEDSLNEIIEKQRITIREFKNKTTETTVICPPKTKWQTFCEWFTWFIIAMILGALIYRFRKLIPFKIPFV